MAFKKFKAIPKHKSPVKEIDVNLAIITQVKSDTIVVAGNYAKEIDIDSNQTATVNF
jgi:hypothetical protein